MILRIIAVTILVTYPTFSFAISLSEAIKSAQKNSFEMLEFQHQWEGARFKADGVDKAHDTTFFTSFITSEDKSAANSLFDPESAKRDEFTIGAKKYFGWGIGFETKLVREKVKTVQTQQAIAAGLVPTTNPYVNVIPEVTISMDLWRNIIANEIDLSREFASSASLNPQYQKFITAQAVAHETEMLYWSLASLNQQVLVSENLLRTTREFASSMKRRMQLGRADEVDVAEAEAKTISQDARTLEFKVARDQLAKKLAYRIYGQPNVTPLRRIMLTEHNPMRLNYRNAPQAIKRAYVARLDLQLLAKFKESQQTKIELSEEQKKPKLR